MLVLASGEVYCQRRETSDAARAKAAIAPDHAGSAGRFYFEGNTALISQILQLLEGQNLSSGTSTPPQDAGSVDTSAWTHRELLAHLRSKGLAVSTHKAIETNPDRTFGGPGLMLVLASGEVYCQLRSTTDAARAKAEVDPEHAGSWGRFYFEGNAPLVSQVIAVLDGRSAPAVDASPGGAPPASGVPRPPVSPVKPAMSATERLSQLTAGVPDDDRFQGWHQEFEQGIDVVWSVILKLLALDGTRIAREDRQGGTLITAESTIAQGTVRYTLYIALNSISSVRTDVALKGFVRRLDRGRWIPAERRDEVPAAILKSIWAALPK